MKRHPDNHPTARIQLLPLILAALVALPSLSLAASVDLATSPLATSTTTTVKPNLLFVLDDSGSMTWTYMPDAADNFRNDYGYHSSQCNAVYYNPTITYKPPLDAAGVAYPDATFTAARDSGFDGSSTARNLNSEFTANRFEPDAANTTYFWNGSYLNGSLGPYGAFYYDYSGAVTTKNYNDTGSTFYTQCNTPIGSATTVFSKRRLATTETTTIVVSGSTAVTTSVSSITVNALELMSAASATSTSTSTVATNIAAKINACTAAITGACGVAGYSATVSGSTVTITGPTSAANFTPVITKSGSMTLTADVFPDTTAAKLTNFANWYSYYRTRMLMMKTSAGHAFSDLDASYRIGLMRINSSSAPVQPVDTFETTHRTNWYTSLYGTAGNSGTPLREALSNAGRYYGGKLAGTDPVQYSCQQNFTILSTDGYWNGSAGFQLDGSTAVGNQDGTAARPMADGAQAGTTVTTTYTRNSYSKVSGGCSGGQRRLKTQPEIGVCSITTVDGVPGAESCSWVNDGAATFGACASSGSITVPSPNPSTRVVSGTPVTTPGTSGGTSDTLADVAMYYYQTDLRTSALGNCGTPISPATVGPLCENNVFIGGTDDNTQQHMTTFTLGLGASGRMTYSPSYLTDSTGDFVSVKLGSTANSAATPPVCSWQANGTVCNWPTPSSGAVENIDDMWHAAVNGRGAYFSATDPTSLSAGLSNALAAIKSRKGSGSAAATSTLNPVAGNNFAYVASYTTMAWKGNLEARGINVDTAAVSRNATWCVENVSAGACAAPGVVTPETSGSTTIYNCVTADSVICPDGVLEGSSCKVPIATACTGTMNALVSDASDTRTIKTANSTGTALIDFDAAYAAANPANFAAAQISTLSQWSSLTPAQQTAAEGANLLKFLRGQFGNEDRPANADRLYRLRDAVLGDTLESQPTFISKPVFSYPYPGYSAYATAQASRAGTVFLGANDGMMHAFAADTGIERWAYVPSMVIPNMWRLADSNYAALHRNFVNGSPSTSDVCTANCSCDTACVAGGGTAPVWKTILVGGLNGGGRGYYALDITVPAAPVLLWELTPTAGIGSVKDDDLGYSFGQPIIARKADGTWVVLVTSGYNNTSPGDGKGYLYVLNAGTGTIISKIATGVGSASTPSGLAKVVAWNDEPAGNQAGYVYGGDLLGNVWRFNINSAVAAVVGTGDALKFASLFSDDAGTSPQPVTTTPVLGKIAGKRVIFIGTGKYLETGDLITTQKQSQYAIKDDDATGTLINPRLTLVEQTLTNNPDGTATRLASSNTVNFFTGRGWYIDFPDSGERANVDSQLVQGVLLIPTIVPSNTACSPGGYGWLNFVDYKTGGAIDSSGLAAYKFDSTIAGFSFVYIDGAPKILPVLSSGEIPPPPEIPFSSGAARFIGKRVLWRELIP